MSIHDWKKVDRIEKEHEGMEIRGNFQRIHQIVFVDEKGDSFLTRNGPNNDIWHKNIESEVRTPKEGCGCEECKPKEKDFTAFLGAAGQGCVSGRIEEWPQLKPACAWALEKLKEAEERAAAYREVACRACAWHRFGGVRSRADVDAEVDAEAKRIREEEKG